MQAMVAAPQGFNVSHMLQPALSVLVSMGLGVIGGAALGALLNAKPATLPRPFAVLGRSLPQPVIARYLKGLYALYSTALICVSSSIAHHWPSYIGVAVHVRVSVFQHVTCMA